MCAHACTPPIPCTCTHIHPCLTLCMQAHTHIYPDSTYMYTHTHLALQACPPNLHEGPCANTHTHTHLTLWLPGPLMVEQSRAGQHGGPLPDSIPRTQRLDPAGSGPCAVVPGLHQPALRGYTAPPPHCQQPLRAATQPRQWQGMRQLVAGGHPGLPYAGA